MASQLSASLKALDEISAGLKAVDEYLKDDDISLTIYKKKVQLIWDHYQSRKLPEETLEPKWIHAGYELAYNYLQGKTLEPDELEVLDQVISSHTLEDGFTVPAFSGQPQSPMRIIHDGWKSGTPTWIFMGRAFTPDSAVHLGADWVAVQRTLPDELYSQMDPKAAPPTLWMAYNLKSQMGMTALTSNVIGPAISFNQLWQAVNADYGPLYRTAANDKYA
jgi:hypothetical protein